MSSWCQGWWGCRGLPEAVSGRDQELLGGLVIEVERPAGLGDRPALAEQTKQHKPHPEPVLAALERLGSSPDEAAFIGDSPFDMGAGKAAGVFTVAVSWGKIHPVERLVEAGADAVVHTPEELLDVL